MRLDCQVVDRVTSRDTPGLNLLSERHGAMILNWGSCRNLPVSAYGTIHLETQWLMRNCPQWKMSDGIRYNVLPKSFSIQWEAYHVRDRYSRNHRRRRRSSAAQGRLEIALKHAFQTVAGVVRTADQAGSDLWRLDPAFSRRMCHAPQARKAPSQVSVRHASARAGSNQREVDCTQTSESAGPTDSCCRSRIRAETSLNQFCPL